MKLFCIFLLSIFLNASPCGASTFYHAKYIYFKLVHANKIIYYPALKLYNIDDVNAMYNGKNIVLFKGILPTLKNDDEIALVLGHELSHFLLKHKGSTPSNEYAADKLGAELENHAGYNSCRARYWFKRFDWPDSATHPASAKRFLRLGKGCS